MFVYLNALIFVWIEYLSPKLELLHTDAIAIQYRFILYLFKCFVSCIRSFV